MEMVTLKIIGAKTYCRAIIRAKAILAFEPDNFTIIITLFAVGFIKTIILTRKNEPSMSCGIVVKGYDFNNMVEIMPING